MYKIKPSNIVIELESPEGNAKLTFRTPKMNEWLDGLQAANNEPDQLEKVRKQFSQVLERLISIEGMVDEDDASVTVERVRNLDFPASVMAAIVSGYSSALNEGAEKETPEKKSGAPA